MVDVLVMTWLQMWHSMQSWQWHAKPHGLVGFLDPFLFQVVFLKKKKNHIIFYAMWPHGGRKINKTLLWNVPTSNNMKRWPLCPWTKGEGFQVGLLLHAKVSRLWEGSASSNPRLVISSSFSLRIIDTIFKAFASHVVYPNLVMKISLVVVLPPFGKEFAQP